MPKRNDRQAVIAVIPHYNMPQTLVRLVKQAMAQKYDAIYVLDDHSTICNIKEVLASFDSAVNLIVGPKNVGSAGNRNRILKVPDKRLVGAILHFIDADCELLTQNIPNIARRIFSDHKIGVVGGLIKNTSGMQMEFNYFPRLSWRGGLSGLIVMIATAFGYTNPHKGKRMPRLWRFLSDYPNPYKQPVAKNVFAVAEANMLIPYNTLVSINGFDGSLRFAEAQDLSFKIEASGLVVRFDPAIAVKHHMVLLPDRKRMRYLLQGFIRLVNKYGIALH